MLERRTEVSGGDTAWLNQQRIPQEQEGRFLQAVLLGGRSRCWAVAKLVNSAISRTNG